MVSRASQNVVLSASPFLRLLRSAKSMPEGDAHAPDTPLRRWRVISRASFNGDYSFLFISRGRELGRVAFGLGFGCEWARVSCLCFIACLLASNEKKHAYIFTHMFSFIHGL